MKSSKTIYIFIISTLFTFNLFSFDWPKNDINLNSYTSYFGQNRGELISSSLCFSEPGEIKAAEDGYILAIINENYDDSDFFPSTLGTAVILSHADNLLSVYGNMDAESITLNDVNEKTVDSGTILGQSGNSGWQNDKSNLEFQIIDTKDQSAINPMVLMPRSEECLPLTLTGIFIENKNHEFFDIKLYKTYPSGLYRIYQKRNPIAVPYKTSVSINGIVLDQLSYDTIIQENKKICIVGKKKYTNKDVYPNDELQLLGESMFTPGKSTLGLSESDILGNVKQINYNITVR
ncbi:MAG: M23 family metallopeptidase [Treponema sp.]|nr:M23 family metallopeptidase [Treponema sp.]